jgi:chromosome segregation ATPase
VRTAKQQGKFNGPVVGPIGHYIKVAPGKEEWAAVAEYAIGHGTLDRFVVTNNHDRIVLQDIRQAAGCSNDCVIFQVGNNPRFAIPPPPVAGIETVASVLTIENDAVFNCLVDNARIDCRALGRDFESSEKALLYKNEKGEDAIKRIIVEVFLLPNGTMWTVKNGSKSIFSNTSILRKTIGVDKSAALQQAKKEEDQFKKEFQQFRAEERRLDQEHTKYQREWNVAKKAMQNNDLEIQDLTTALDDMRAEIETSANVTVDTSEYEQDVDQAEQELDSLKHDDAKLKNEIEALTPDIEKIKARIAECEARNEKVYAEMKAADDSLTQLLQSKTQEKGKLEKKLQKLEKIRAAIETSREKALALEEDKNSSLHKARKLTYRLQVFEKHNGLDDSTRSQKDSHASPSPEELEAIEPAEVEREARYYEAKMNKLQSKIDEEKAHRKMSKEEPAVAYEKYMRAANDLACKQKYTQELDGKIDDLTSDMEKRQKLWKGMRKHLQKTTAIKFDELLSLNQYSGKVEFDEEEETLDLFVSKESATGPQNKDVKSLRYV